MSTKLKNGEQARISRSEPNRGAARMIRIVRRVRFRWLVGSYYKLTLRTSPSMIVGPCHE
jgi:hypothetical protein